MTNRHNSLMREINGISALFDEIFSSEVGCNLNRLPEVLVSSAFPPCNIYKTKEGDEITYEFALAGYSEKEIEISFEDNHMILKLSSKESNEDRDYIQKGIKSGKNESRYYIPVNKFDTAESKAVLSNGILSITIPKREELKPTAITIQME